MRYIFRSQSLMRTFAFLALHPEDEYGAADIAEFVGVTRPSIVQALGYLERDGLVTKRSVGKKRLYRIKTDNAYYPELRSIALKTLGGIETIAKEIQDDPAIGFAAVFGSFARGDEGAQSDIDVLFVIDDEGWEETDYRIAAAMAGVSEQIARRVSPNIYRASEFERLRQETNPAIEQILSSPMTVLKGKLGSGLRAAPQVMVATREQGTPSTGKGQNGRVETVLAAGAAALLQRYQGESTKDRHVRFVLLEIGPANYSFARSMAEVRERQVLGHLMFLRLVAEIGVRFAWITERGNGDPADTRKAIDSIVKRDFMHLRSANKALRQSSTSHDQQIAAIEAKEAPRQFEQLATATTLAANSYSMFRFASALVHPGLGLRDLISGAPDMEIGLRDCFATCVVLGAELLSILAPDVEPYDPAQLLGHPILSYSPTAIALRLRRQMRDAFGPAAPRVTNVVMSVATTERGLSQTLEAELQSDVTRWTITGSDSEPDAAYDALRKAAMEPR